MTKPWIFWLGFFVYNFIYGCVRQCNFKQWSIAFTENFMIRKSLAKIKEVLRLAIVRGATPKKLALSAAIGVYTAFSPFPGLHTVMMIGFTWLLKLNFPTLFVFTSINNPWTMIPFFSLDYAFGYWFVHNFIGWNPGWTLSLTKIFGSGSICLWSFFIP